MAEGVAFPEIKLLTAAAVVNRLLHVWANKSCTDQLRVKNIVITTYSLNKQRYFSNALWDSKLFLLCPALSPVISWCCWKTHNKRRTHELRLLLIWAVISNCSRYSVRVRLPDLTSRTASAIVFRKSKRQKSKMKLLSKTSWLKCLCIFWAFWSSCFCHFIFVSRCGTRYRASWSPVDCVWNDPVDSVW